MWEGGYLAALNAETGKEIWNEKISAGNLQGYIALSDTDVFVPAGKGKPTKHARSNGKKTGNVDSLGGSTVMVVDDVTIAGPSWWGNWLRMIGTTNGELLMEMDTANRVVTSPTMLYVARGGGVVPPEVWSMSRIDIRAAKLGHQKGVLAQTLSQAKPESAGAGMLKKQIAALDTDIAKVKAEAAKVKTWKRKCRTPDFALIRAGNVLLRGSEGAVTAFDTTDGETLWTGKVDGKAYALAVANGRLLVGTDKGTLHCFGPGGAETSVVKEPAPADPYPADTLTPVYAAAAAKIAAANPFSKGYALVLGCGEGRFAYEIAKRTGLTVVARDPDADKVARARAAMIQAGLHGTRVTVHHGPMDKLPYTKYMFNIVVSDQTLTSGELPPSAKEVYRVLRPCGGLLHIGRSGPSATLKVEEQQAAGMTRERLQKWIGAAKMAEKAEVLESSGGLWAVVRRGKLPGSGEWSHQYANVGNTGCSEDTLIQKPFQIQWYGRPGPKHMFDRHSMTHAPISSNGRLFVIGEKVAWGLDAYNGTVLWRHELPELKTRVNIPRDSGFLAANKTHAFLAVGNKCLPFDGDSGNKLPPFELPAHKQTGEKKFEYEWGLVAVDGDLLFGNGVRKDSFYRHGRRPWYDRDTAKINSDFHFAYNLKDRSLKWKYDGVVIASTITMGGGRMYFFEHREKPVLDSDSRLLSEATGLILVVLDPKTGRKLYEKPYSFASHSAVFYVCYKDEVLAFARQRGGEYEIHAVGAADGRELWQQRHKPFQYHHGSHRRKPLIIGNVLLEEPWAYDLKTGKRRWQIGYRTTCGSPSACANYVFARDHSHMVYDVKALDGGTEGKWAEPLSPFTRPGCHINIVSAGGLILSSESSSGCSCGYPLQATFAMTAEE